jgi:hypothetical protein
MPVFVSSLSDWKINNVDLRTPGLLRQLSRCNYPVFTVSAYFAAAFREANLVGERSLKRALHHEIRYHEERNHQGKDNLLLFLYRVLQMEFGNRGFDGLGIASQPSAVVAHVHE